jgi:branched-chain amino acid transport system permease protein
MSLDLSLLLTQDGVTNGAIYALLALTFVLIFAVTRIIFVPQGEFVSYGALTPADLQAGVRPGVTWVLLALGVCIAILDVHAAWRLNRPKAILRTAIVNVAMPIIIAIAVTLLAPLKPPLPVQMLLTLVLVLPLGPMIFRLAFRPLADASVLTYTKDRPSRA